MKRLSTCAIAALALICGCHREISGTYLASDDGSVVSVQLVRTPDDHLTGQLAIAQLKPDGTIDRKSATLTGAVDGENLSVTSAGFLGIQSMTLSGTLNGDTLILAGPQAQPVILKRSSLSSYQTQLNALDGRSQALLAAKANALSRQRTEQAQRNFVAAADRLVGQMQQFDQQADVHLGRFPADEKRYQAITAKISSYVEKEHRLTASPDAAVDRSGFSTDATVTAIDTNLLHIDVQSVQSSVAMDVKPLVDEATGLKAVCSASSPPITTITPAEIDTHNAACGRFLAALPIFLQKYDALRAGFAHLEQVYAQENNTQQALLQTAQSLAGVNK